MAYDFGTMVARIARELRRSNITADIKAAINDAIIEASKTRFYLNEMIGYTFNTVPGQEYYPDLGLNEIDCMWWMNGSSRWNVELENNIDADNYATGTISGGQISSYSRYGMQLRLYPIPSTVITLNVSGFGKLAPWPLVADADTNNWMVEAERYIRALAKSILMKDVIRDFGEATAYEAIAADLKDDLLSITESRSATGQLQSTQF